MKLCVLLKVGYCLAGAWKKNSKMELGGGSWWLSYYAGKGACVPVSFKAKEFYVRHCKHSALLACTSTFFLLIYILQIQREIPEEQLLEHSSLS